MSEVHRPRPTIGEIIDSLPLPTFAAPDTTPLPAAPAPTKQARLPKLPAALYEEYPTMSAQAHEAMVKDYARAALAARQATDHCAMCNDTGIVGRPPDDYFDCPDCVAARQAPAEAPKDVLAAYTHWMNGSSNFPHANDKRHPYDAFKAGVEFTTAPDSRDAARYRWLRDPENNNGSGYIAAFASGILDAKIDAAIAQEKAQ